MTLPPVHHPVHSHPRREFLASSVACRVPWPTLRTSLLARLGVRIEDPESTFIARSVRFLAPESLRIGARTSINFEVLLDARGGLRLGRDVSIAPRAMVITGFHEVDDDMATTFQPVAVGDRAVIGSGAIVLPGVEVGEGAVIGAGAVVTHDVETWTVVAGVPARTVRQRCSDQRYELGEFRPSWH
jgi:acetyltransferase-like isoleucine patch superfamily enzyme